MYKEKLTRKQRYMSKLQKTWLSLFAAMFLLPEILWSPVGNYIYELSQGSGKIIALRSNFITTSTNYSFIWYGLVTLIQLLGLIGCLIYLFVIKKKYPKNQLLLNTSIFLAIILLILNLLTFYLVTFVGVSFP